MKVGLLVPSIYMQKKYLETRISAPMKLALVMAKYLKRRGHEVIFFAGPDVPTEATVVSSDTELLDERLILDYQQDIPKDSYKTLTLYETKKYYELGLTLRAYQYAKEHNVDVMHQYHSLGNLSHYFEDVYKIPTVYTLHILPPEVGTLTNWRYRKFNKSHFIGISQSQKKMFEDVVPNINIVNVIQHGVELDSIEYNEIPEDYYAFIGRLIPEKGLDLAIQAISDADNLKVATWINPVIEETEYYQKEIKPFISQKHVEILGLLDEQKRNNFLKNAKAFIFPLRWEEPFGMVLIEAMACGTPVIAFAKGSIPEIIRDGETGFIVNSSDDDKRGDWIIKSTGIQGLREAIAKLNSLSSEEYRQMRKNCRELVEKKFSAELMAENYEEVYKNLASNSI